jgi:hypothetical protein
MKFNFNFFKKPKKSTIVVSNEGSVNDVLSINQRCVARVWYNSHKEHIDKMVSEAEKAYSPSLFEDKNNPMLWKAEHWKWYLKSGLY